MSITLIIIAITVIISFSAFNNDTVYSKLILWPRIMDRPKEYYRLLTSGFIHADWLHLILNMFVLFMFGELIENYFTYDLGKPYLFPILYLAGIITASLPSFAKHRNNGYYRSLGASGGVASVLFSFVYLAPWHIIYVWFIPMPAIVAAVLYLVYSVYMSRKGSDNINHDAHFWGAVFGLFFTFLFDPYHGREFFSQIMHPPFL